MTKKHFGVFGDIIIIIIIIIFFFVAYLQCTNQKQQYLQRRVGHSQNIKYQFYFNFRFCVSEEKTVLKHLSITDRSERRIYANAYKML